MPLEAAFDLPIVNDEVLLRNHRIPVVAKEVPHQNLRYYLENPRLYSLLRIDGKEPTQEEIEEELFQMDHVKELAQAIALNGGLIDPVIVRGGDMVVLEGNSRLAAYRMLAKKDPLKWGKLKARVLPHDVSESDIFALLGEYHLHGKTSWSPFEQAGYLYRRHKFQNVSVETLVKEVNIRKSEIMHLISVRDFMLKHGEQQPSRWSYYDEYLKSRIIAKARETYEEMDELVVKKIRSGEIATAMDLRDGLRAICQAGGKTLHRFVEQKTDFETACDLAERKGANDATVKKLAKFRTWLADAETAEDLLAQKTRYGQLCYELEGISKHSTKLLKKLKGAQGA
jgi:hypothetical protein